MNPSSDSGKIEFKKPVEEIEISVTTMASLLKENEELKALLEPFRKLANSVLIEREVLPSESEMNRPLYSFNFSDITYNDLRNIINFFKAKSL